MKKFIGNNNNNIKLCNNIKESINVYYHWKLIKKKIFFID